MNLNEYSDLWKYKIFARDGILQRLMKTDGLSDWRVHQPQTGHRVLKGR
jgi:hypothetical protein